MHCSLTHAYPTFTYTNGVTLHVRSRLCTCVYTQVCNCVPSFWRGDPTTHAKITSAHAQWLPRSWILDCMLSGCQGHGHWTACSVVAKVMDTGLHAQWLPRSWTLDCMLSGCQGHGHWTAYSVITKVMDTGLHAQWLPRSWTLDCMDIGLHAQWLPRSWTLDCMLNGCKVMDTGLHAQWLPRSWTLDCMLSGCQGYGHSFDAGSASGE